MVNMGINTKLIFSTLYLTVEDNRSWTSEIVILAVKYDKGMVTDNFRDTDISG